MTGVGLVLHRVLWLAVRIAILLAVASAPLAILLDDSASANSLRFLGITPLTITSYERPPGDRVGFEPFAFGKDVEVVLRTAAPTVGWAYACNGTCTGDAERDGQLAAQALSTVRVSKRPISLSGFSTRHAPGTQHHNVALLALQSPRSAADRHRMLCAGGDGYGALREVIAMLDQAKEREEALLAEQAAGYEARLKACADAAAQTEAAPAALVVFSSFVKDSSLLL